MMFSVVFLVLLTVAVTVGWSALRNVSWRKGRHFNDLKRRYSLVYLLAVTADWLQGPHVYAFYESRGFSRNVIERLFVVGFASSLFSCFFVGFLADSFGRRTTAILYGLFYIVDCMTKHSSNFPLLVFGRICGGAATSILFSVFESWLVCESGKEGMPTSVLADVFSETALGSSLLAILAGVIAQVAVNNFGYTAPFDLAAVLLFVMVIAASFMWTENYGSRSAPLRSSVAKAFKVILKDKSTLCIGLTQSAFESVMYIFVLEWTPALSTVDVAIPHGVVFSTFMIATFVGSSLTSSFENCYHRLKLLLAVSTLSMFGVVIFAGNQLVVYLCFIVFEVCVGSFWPTISILKSQSIPEEQRATVMNLFRVPLNVVVITALTSDLPLSVMFSCCTVLLFLAFLCVTIRGNPISAASARVWS